MVGSRPISVSITTQRRVEMQRIRSLAVTALACLFVFLFASAAWAAPALQLQWGKDTNAVQACDDLDSRAPIINVIEFVTGDVDSGTAGNYWAYDEYTRHIQVYQNATEGSFCASVDYQGSFKPIAGQQSPGANHTPLLGDKDNGRMQGGYVGTIVGTLLTNPEWVTNGNVGSYDYACNPDGTDCKYVSWISKYFEPSATFSYVNWGWIYRAGKYGTWVNADNGNSGDIQ